MLTEKENLLMALRGEQPEWVPRIMYPSPGRPPASTGCMPSILMERRTPQGGFDVWGVEYTATADTGGMALPTPGKFMLDDITKWRDVIKAPDISHVDWEAMAKKDLAHIDRSQTAVTVNFGGGYFLQLAGFMGFNEGMMAMVEEPDEVYELFEYLNEFNMEVARNVLEYYKPDFWEIGDDVATAFNPFISPATYRELVKPFAAREAKLGAERGLPVNMHCCGHCESLIDDWLEIGVTAWNPAQVMNDLPAIKKKYGNKLVLIGCWDSSGPAGWPGSSEEVVKNAVRECIDAYAPGGGFVFWASSYGSPDDQDYINKARWITEEYDAYGRTFYNKKISYK